MVQKTFWVFEWAIFKKKINLSMFRHLHNRVRSLLTCVLEYN